MLVKSITIPSEMMLATVGINESLECNAFNKDYGTTYAVDMTKSKRLRLYHNMGSCIAVINENNDGFAITNDYSRILNLLSSGRYNKDDDNIRFIIPNFAKMISDVIVEMINSIKNPVEIVEIVETVETREITLCE